MNLANKVVGVIRKGKTFQPKGLLFRRNLPKEPPGPGQYCTANKCKGLPPYPDAIEHVSPLQIDHAILWPLQQVKSNGKRSLRYHTNYLLILRIQINMTVTRL